MWSWMRKSMWSTLPKSQQPAGSPLRRKHAAANPSEEFTVEGTVLHDGSPRLLQINGIPLESQLEGTILYLRNRDEPGVIGQGGSTLGQLAVNIATFALGRRQANVGAEAAALVRLDGAVPASILEPIKRIRAITEAPLLHLGNPPA